MGSGVVWICNTVLLLSSFGCCAAAAAAGNEKVEVALYYETLCPYCSRFMVNYLPTIFQNQLIDVIHLNLVPYGNARLGSNNTITCQHGQYECLLNTVEACSIHVWPDLKKHYKFIYCVERLVVEHKYTEWESCFGSTGFDSKPIEDCYKSGLGKQLDLAYAKETNKLNPPHKYVPWVTVNGQPLYDDYQNFTSYVCKAYKGSRVPKGCKDPPIVSLSSAKDNLKQQVCHSSSSSLPKTESIKIRSRVTSWRRQMKATPQQHTSVVVT